jgi:phosphatidate cytidylyltransferase
MHLKRWITSLVLLPLVVLLIYKGGAFLFAAFICILCITALSEYFRIVFNTSSKPENPDRLAFSLSGYFFGPVIIMAAYINSFDIILSLIILNFICCALISLNFFRSDSSVSDRFARQVSGVIYIPLSLSCLVLIRNSIDGIVWIFFLLALVFAGDTGAFYAGNLLGKHKLCPEVSPGKTVEGSIGGLLANLAVGFIFIKFFLKTLPLIQSIFFVLLIGIVAQAGDLFESALKRNSGVKDSGSILPGHGGIMDRIDALLFAAPVAFLFKEYIFC